MPWVTQLVVTVKQKLRSSTDAQLKILLAVLNWRSSCFRDTICHDFRER